MSDIPLQIVWFKRDLRLEDHPALVRAALAGRVLPLVIVEPGYWMGDDTSHRHYRYLSAGIEDLSNRLREQGAGLCLRVGFAPEVLCALCKQVGPFTLWSHQETGNLWTFARDKAVAAWARETGTVWHQPMTFGIARGSSLNRDKWAKSWDAMMDDPVCDLPRDVAWASAPSDDLPAPEELGLKPDGLTWMQETGREAGMACLNTFLYERGRNYRSEMSTPIEGESACSRLSIHLAYGSLSMREIYQATRARLDALEQGVESAPPGWKGSLKSFIGRLHWHCHFMQKLEAEPQLEWWPMARSYAGIRDAGIDAEKLAAFAEGRTGYPFVDACVRYLRAKGWLNFRMRAMLQSFASYNLWLPWQESGLITARYYSDYEPGIHWTQSQMQSGETGINTLRIYSPVKQGHDQDPDGVFTRTWVPELAHLDGGSIHEPWKAGQQKDYPDAIVDYASSAKAAREKIWAVKKTPAAKEEAERVFEKHGSRKRPRSRGSGKRNRAA
ncbi:MAG: FAD-binding domain-containing protein [Pseudomonadota bacterium]